MTRVVDLRRARQRCGTRNPNYVDGHGTRRRLRVQERLEEARPLIRSLRELETKTGGPLARQLRLLWWANPWRHGAAIDTRQGVYCPGGGFRVEHYLVWLARVLSRVGTPALFRARPGAVRVSQACRRAVVALLEWRDEWLNCVKEFGNYNPRWRRRRRR